VTAARLLVAAVVVAAAVAVLASEPSAPIEVCAGVGLAASLLIVAHSVFRLIEPPEHGR
jgi:hypothetical protein